jgi:hypothetical protein
MQENKLRRIMEPQVKATAYLNEKLELGSDKFMTDYLRLHRIHWTTPSAACYIRYGVERVTVALCSVWVQQETFTMERYLYALINNVTS